MQINITVRNKVATNAGAAFLVCGNSDYKVEFDFDAEWDDYDAKTARFVCDDGRYIDQVFTGNECPVPVIERTSFVRIGVFAGNLHTTTPARVEAARSILCTGGAPADPAPDVYNQIMDMLANGAGGVAGKDGGYYVPTVIDGVLSWTASKDKMPDVPSSDIKGAPGYTPVKGVDYHDGEPGAKGVTFTPYIDEYGWLEWSNDGGLDNPDPIKVHGDDGNGIKTAVLNANYTLTLTFDDGTTYTTPSLRGAPGEDGDPGDDGVGIASIKQTTTSSVDGGSNVFTVTLTNGTTATFTVKNGSKGSPGDDGVSPTVTTSKSGKVTTLTIKDAAGTKTATINDGEDGDDGNGIKTAVLNANYTLTLTFDDGTTYTTPSLRGAPGEDGDPGDDGVGIASIKQTTTSSADGGSNVFTVTLTNGTTATFTVKNGSKGSPGDDGVSPTVTTSKSGKVTTLTIKDAAGTKTATINDGEDGDDGQRGTGILNATTGIAAYTTTVGGVTPAYRILLSTLKTQSKVSDVLVGDTVRYSYYVYPVVYVDTEYAYLGTRVSIRGAAGTTPVKGTDYYTSADKTEMVGLVKAAMPTLTMVGTDEDGVEHTWTIYGTAT